MWVGDTELPECGHHCCACSHTVAVVVALARRYVTVLRVAEGAPLHVLTGAASVQITHTFDGVTPSSFPLGFVPLD